jgi:hypothetical protein
MWAELCQDAPAKQKIDTMRVFSDCLDVTENDGDGWIVGHALITTMKNEEVHMTDTGVAWLLRLKQKEMIVAFGASTIWHGLQHAVREFLIQEHESHVLQRLLELDSEKEELQIKSQVNSIAHWLALRQASWSLPYANASHSSMGVSH